MLDKMMTSKILVKKYDMKTIQGVRRGQFWASLIMCFTHLRRGMIKPMILQVSGEEEISSDQIGSDQRREHGMSLGERG